MRVKIHQYDYNTDSRIIQIDCVSSRSRHDGSLPCGLWLLRVALFAIVGCFGVGGLVATVFLLEQRLGM